MTTIELNIKSPDAMITLGRAIGNALKGGECLELTSDVGGGKTTFVRGLAKGAGSGDHVSSPTFTISKVYKTPKFSIVHFDFYRLSSADLIEHEIEEEVLDPSSVIVVEWSEIVHHVLPEERIKIHISVTADESRKVTLSCSDKYGYIIECIQ